MDSPIPRVRLEGRITPVCPKAAARGDNRIRWRRAARQPKRRRRRPRCGHGWSIRSGSLAGVRLRQGSPSRAGEKRAAACAAPGRLEPDDCPAALAMTGDRVSGICWTNPAETEPAAIPPRKRAFGASGPQETDHRRREQRLPQPKPRKTLQIRGSLAMQSIYNRQLAIVENLCAELGVRSMHGSVQGSALQRCQHPYRRRSRSIEAFALRGTLSSVT